MYLNNKELLATTSYFLLIVLANVSLSSGQKSLDDMLGNLESDLPSLIDESLYDLPDIHRDDKGSSSGSVGALTPSLSLQVMVDTGTFQIVCSVDKMTKKSPISVLCPLANDTPGSKCFEECLRFCSNETCQDNPQLNKINCQKDTKGNTYRISWSGSSQMMNATGKWTCSYAGIKKEIDLDLSAYTTTTSTTTKSPIKYRPPTTVDPQLLHPSKTILDNPKYNLLDPPPAIFTKDHPNISTSNKPGFIFTFFRDLQLTKPVLVIGLLTLLIVSIVVNVAFCIRCLLMRRYLHLRGQLSSLTGPQYRGGGMVHEMDNQKAPNPSMLSYVFCCYCCQDGGEMNSHEVTSQILINDPTYDMNNQRRYDALDDPEDMRCLENCLCLPKMYEEKLENFQQHHHYVRNSQPILYQDSGTLQHGYNGTTNPGTIYGSSNKLFPYLQTTTSTAAASGVCGPHALFTNYRSNSTNELMYEEMIPATLGRFQPVIGESKKIRSLLNTPMQEHNHPYNMPMLITTTTNPSQNTFALGNSMNPDLQGRLMSRSFTSQQFQTLASATPPDQGGPAKKVLVPASTINNNNDENNVQVSFSRYNSLPRSPTVPGNTTTGNTRLNPIATTSCNSNNSSLIVKNQSYVYAISKKHDFPQTKYHNQNSVTMIGGSEDSGVHANSSNEKLNNNNSNSNNYDQSPLTTTGSNHSNSYNSPTTDHNNTLANGDKCVRLEMTKNLMKKADLLLREADGLLNE